MKNTLPVLSLLELTINVRAIGNPSENATPDEVGNIIVLRARLQNGCFHPHLGVVTAELGYYADDVVRVVHETERQVIPAFFVVLRYELVISVGFCQLAIAVRSCEVFQDRRNEQSVFGLFHLLATEQRHVIIAPLFHSDIMLSS